MSPLIKNGLSERDLILQSISGDRKAQKELYEMYAPHMMAVCERYARHRLEAEDIFQDAFIKAFNHLNEFKFEGSFEGWLRRIFIHTAIKNNQKKSVSHEIIGLQDEIYHDSIAPEILASMEEQELMALISTLPDGYRTVFNLFVIEGLSHKEIGEMLHIEDSTSRSQLTKAKKLLKDKISQLYKVAG